MIPLKYSDVFEFRSGRARVVLGSPAHGEVFYIDSMGHEIFRDDEGAHTSQLYFNEGLKSVYRHYKEKKKGKTQDLDVYQFIDTNGNLAFPARFNDVCTFHEGLAAAAPVDLLKLGYIDKSGRFVIPPTFDPDFPVNPRFVGGLAPVSIDRGDHWGYINRQGSLVILPKFRWARNFSDGLAAVRIGYRWGFVNTKGRLVIPVKYDWVSNFSNGICIAYLGGISAEGDPLCQDGGNFFVGSRTVLIDKTGKQPFKLSLQKNETISDFQEGVAVINPIPKSP